MGCWPQVEGKCAEFIASKGGPGSVALSVMSSWPIYPEQPCCSECKHEVIARTASVEPNELE